MAKTHEFGAVLARTRREQGFPNAHAFFKGRDGRKMLKLTFRSYLDIEQGKSLPKPERLEAILLALGLDPHQLLARELVAAYFASLGMERLARMLAPGVAPVEPGQDQLPETRQAVQKLLVQLSVEQWRAVSATFENDTCDNVLVNTYGGVRLSELAAMTGLSRTAVERAVRSLAAAGLATLAGDRARSTLEDKITDAPPSSPAMVTIRANMQKYLFRNAAEGQSLRNTTNVVRLTQPGLERFGRFLDQVRDVAELNGDAHAKDDSAIYMVRTQIVKLYPRGSKTAG